MAEKQATKKNVKKLASVPLGSPEAILLTVSLLAHRYAIFLGSQDVEIYRVSQKKRTFRIVWDMCGDQIFWLFWLF